MKTGDKLKNYCITCKRTTNHIVLYSKEVESDDFYYDETTYYTVIQCAGCDNVSYRTQNIDQMHPEHDEYGEWGPSITISTFPRVLKKHTNTIRRNFLPKQIGIVYEEAIAAFTAECYLLTGVAFRAVIEAICIDKDIKGKDLNAKITNLVKGKLITENEADRLHAIRFMGNDSVHEMSVPTTDKLYIVLSTVEHLLNNLYIIDKQIKHKLETVIGSYDEFKTLLESKLMDCKIGEVLSLIKILGKSYRRLNNRAAEFEIELQKEIDSNSFKYLSKAEIVLNPDSKKQYHNYTILDIPEDEPLPF